MRFLVDAQLPPGLAQRLCSRGHQADHVRDVGLAVETDRRIVRYAQENRCVIITKDVDFARLVLRTPTLKVVWLRVGNSGTDELLELLDPVFHEIELFLEAGEKLIEVNR